MNRTSVIGVLLLQVLQGCANSEITAAWADIEGCTPLSYVEANESTRAETERELLLRAKELGGNKVFMNPNNPNELIVLRHDVDGNALPSVALEGRAYFCD
jgi:hypothetical protein